MTTPAQPGAPQRPEAYWGAHAREYNDFIVRVVPRYEEMMDLMLEYAPAKATRVLELGTGTGNLSLRLAARWPDAHFMFVDGAPEMLDVTRMRVRAQFADIADRATLQAVRFEELALEPASIDVVVASLSLHHVLNVGAVYERIAPALTASGRFIMLDGVAGETDTEQAAHMRRWDAFMQAHMTETELRDIKQHILQHDHYRSLSEHYELLEHAGFAYTDCVWRDGLFTLMVAAV